MYNFNVEFVFEHMVILTSVEVFKQGLDEEDIVNIAKDNLISYYKIDPEVLYLQDVIVHEVQYVDEQGQVLYV